MIQRACLIMKSIYLVQTKISSESDFNFSILLRILVHCSWLKFPSFRALRQPRERVLKQVFLIVLWLGLLHTGVDLKMGKTVFRRHFPRSW